MYNTNDWFYFTEGVDKKTCNKIRNSAKGKWVESEIDTKKGITDEERISGAKPIVRTWIRERSVHRISSERRQFFTIAVGFTHLETEQANVRNAKPPA